MPLRPGLPAVLAQKLPQHFRVQIPFSLAQAMMLTPSLILPIASPEEMAELLFLDLAHTSDLEVSASLARLGGDCEENECRPLLAVLSIPILKTFTHGQLFPVRSCSLHYR